MAMLTYPPFPLDAILTLHWVPNSLFASVALVNDQTLSSSLVAKPKIQVLPGLPPLKRDPAAHGSAN